MVTTLPQHIQRSFDELSSLDPDEMYYIGFSGGKDSHAVLGLYLAWCKHTGRSLNVIVIFADTYLETPVLYALVDKAERYCLSQGLEFRRSYPSIEWDYWVVQVGYGYPVPDHINRWCTGKLKIRPMGALGNGRIAITGVHFGESDNRDRRLSKSGCGSTECGVGEVEDAIEIIRDWRNCNVWDWLFDCDDKYLYEGVLNELSASYQINEDESGSLRMGCFDCPVVSISRIEKQVADGIIPPQAIEVRRLKEELRNAPRLNSNRKKPNGDIILGAIQKKYRVDFWRRLSVHFGWMKEYGWIRDEVIAEVDRLLGGLGYPETYTINHILAEEERIDRLEQEYLLSEIETLEENRVVNLQTTSAPSLDNMFVYTFPAIAGVQGGQPFYTSMVPLKVLARLLVFNESELPEEFRAQRPLNQTRIPQISSYITNNLNSYTFGSLMVALDSNVGFKSADGMIGVLQVPMDAMFRIVDGQHRLYGIREALSIAPELGDETISVIFYINCPLALIRQKFADTNQNVSKPSLSLNINYNGRDDEAILTRRVSQSVELFRRYMDTERTSLPAKSPKMFCLNHLFEACRYLLKPVAEKSLDEKADIAIAFWEAVAPNMLEWQNVAKNTVAASSIRKSSLSTHGVTLIGLGLLGAKLIGGDYAKQLVGLQDIDWHKNNLDWEGIALSDGTVKKSVAVVSAIANYLEKKILD